MFQYLLIHSSYCYCHFTLPFTFMLFNHVTENPIIFYLMPYTFVYNLLRTARHVQVSGHVVTKVNERSFSSNATTVQMLNIEN